MDQATLVRDEITAGAEFIEALNRWQPISYAFWLKEPGCWRELYLASPGFTHQNAVEGYTEVMRILKEMNDPNLRPTGVSLLTMDNPLVRAAQELASKQSGRLPARPDVSWFGGVEVEELFFYTIT